jgi:hypothetical protein
MIAKYITGFSSCDNNPTLMSRRDCCNEFAAATGGRPVNRFAMFLWIPVPLPVDFPDRIPIAPDCHECIDECVATICHCG